MYIESVPNRDSPPAVLLRESYREGGKVKKRTLLNLSDWRPELVEGFRTLLKGGHAVAGDGITIHRSLPHGHVAAVLGTVRRIGLDGLLGRPTPRLRALVLALLVRLTALVFGVCKGRLQTAIEPETHRRSYHREQRQNADTDERGDGRPPPGPTPAAFPGADRPGADRLAGQAMPQVLRQFSGAAIALARLLLKAFQTNRGQIARQIGPDPPRRGSPAYCRCPP